ncbi:hypothetical protein [Fusobacterium varium]|uniref:hypothetical protein n=1 Tax=Fusobacterium varium TaxID=856 RepID=UPI00241E18FE|nr:hypothetical protein [Fusobacterium varium]
MIRELDKKEIKEIEDYLQTFKDKEEYKNYFYGAEKQSYSDRGFVINESYYCDLEIINNIPFLGMFKLKDGSLKSIILLFKNILSEYGVIGLWRTVENIQVKKLHEHIKKRYPQALEIIKNNIVVIVIRR